MSTSFNQCTFIGRLGKEPELNVTPNGTPVTKFSLAVDQGIKDAKGKNVPLWLNIVTWNKLAEIVEKYAEKGRLVMVQGRLQIRAYQDKEGNNRQAIDIVANTVQLLDSKPGEATNGAGSAEENPYDPFNDHP